MKSRKTTIAGIVAALGLLLPVLGHLFGENGPGVAGLMDPLVVGQLTAALGALLVGLFARDDNVTSEGTPAPKDAPVPTGRPWPS